ncbi:FAD dependent oxidoreductase [Chaetomium fimeti]|uniref:FAD dependent oxidoreductase n=1 Tax=Chaetomium fimeti TaxID=1854472 RepID=A0AAE0H9I5_9PEZI|nr:FAD dependent oxidoreductase [Chaetomium fimeti]
MDERARIPVSLPCANPTVSYWQDPPDELADHRSTAELPDTADTVIIGSGITGAAVAWGLLQGPNPGSILMLEARQACSGATGRNGGHTKAASYRTFAHHTQSHSRAIAKQIARLELRNIRAVHAFARAHAVPCDLHPCDTLDVVYDPAEWAAAREGVAALRAAFPPFPSDRRYTLYSREEVLRRFPVHDGVFEGREERVQGGVGYFAGSLSAYKFGIGVLRACVERGLNLQTGTAVTGLVAVSPAAAAAAGKERWEVSTERGVVRAGRVVLATNGYTAGVWRQFQGAVVPLRGQVTAQRPGQGMPAGGCLDRTYSFIYGRGYEYMVSQPEGSRFAGDIVMGGGLARAQEEGLMEYGTTDDGAMNGEISQYLRETTERYFGPDWGEDDPDGRVRSEWTGIMGFSPDGFPFVGEVPGESGLWTSCGFQGHGMVLCWECARALVEMMEGRDGEELREWFPDVFRITQERMAQRFRGRLDAIPKDGESN